MNWPQQQRVSHKSWLRCRRFIAFAKTNFRSQESWLKGSFTVWHMKASEKNTNQSPEQQHRPSRGRQMRQQWHNLLRKPLFFHAHTAAANKSETEAQKAFSLCHSMWMLLIKSSKLWEMKLSLVDSQLQQIHQLQLWIPNGHNTNNREGRLDPLQ